MNTLWNSFDKNRDSLDMQYENAWANGETFAAVDKLKNDVLLYAETLSSEPHPVIKAKCFSYILEHAPIYINSDDWFGIALTAQKMSCVMDIGCHYEKILNSLSAKWTDEIKNELYPEEDADFSNNARGGLLNEFYIDYNHSTPCWEDIFSLGISGILSRAMDYEKKVGASPYFDGIKITYTAIIALFHRYADALSGRTEPKLVRMREAFENLSSNPPANTYEAMLLAWQFWFIQENIDCVRARTMGGIDNLYYDFYKKDVESGLFTEENIKELFIYFMSAFNSMRVAYQQPMYLGGVNESGECIVNELSYIALDAYNTLRAPNPKLQIKVGKNTPDRFLLETLRVIRNGNSSISIINDDNAALSLMKLGVTREEALTNLMSGCWDYAVKNREVKTVPVRVSLPKILEYTLFGGRDMLTGKQVGCEMNSDFESFDSLLSGFKEQWLYIWRRVKNIIERWESHLDVISPSNMYSATMTDSLERGTDGYARGMKYNNTVYTSACLASLIDGLSVVKKFVFDKKIITLAELTSAVKSNWQGYENLRKIILNDKDKFGNGSDIANALAKDITDFIAMHVNGAPNSRGGYWKFGILSIDKNVRFGSVSGASVDGRMAGEPFSKNLCSVVGMDRGGVTTLMNSVCHIDATNLPHSGMLDVVLHPTAVSGEDGLVAFCGLVKGYFAKGGHSLQFNIFSADTLKEAQKNPEKYRNLQIRVCGWNVYFVNLEKIQQDAFIKQCEHYEALGV